MSDKPFAPECKANGCPLRATVVTDWWEREKKRDPRLPRWGVCDYHRAAPASEWVATTRRILENKHSLQVSNDLRNITDPRYKPLTGESIDNWLTRVDRYHKARILPGLSPSSDDIQPGSFESIHHLLGNDSKQAENVHDK